MPPRAAVDGIVDRTLEGVCGFLGYDSGMLLHLEVRRGILTTIGSRGYERSGIGSEVPVGEGIIGTVAERRHPIKVSDMSRVRRLGAAVLQSSAPEERTRTIALPGLPDAASQIGIPMIAQGRLAGVLFVESRKRLAFTSEAEAVLSIIARHAASALALAERIAEEAHGDRADASVPPPDSRVFRVTHYAFDDSVFIDNAYVIKGVPGRLLVFMLEIVQREGRDEFSNREMRLSEALRLPDIKDNLETRLLLLLRRLQEKDAPVQLLRIGRGRIRLQLRGSAVVDRVEGRAAG